MKIFGKNRCQGSATPNQINKRICKSKLRISKYAWTESEITVSFDIVCRNL